jgi:TM2 domain-containing membrane protein YozV
MFCKECGNQISDKAAICMKCGVPTGSAPLPGTSSAKSRITYILLGLFFGGLGIHNFYAGYKAKAVAQLLITVLTGWLIYPLIAVGIWVLIEICTVKKDAQGVQFT